MDNLSLSLRETQIRKGDLCRRGKYLHVPGRRSYCGETADEKQEIAGFRLWTRNYSRSSNQNSSLTEHSSIWIHASRAKLVEKGPGPDPREKRKGGTNGGRKP
ncbi:unnamed protein product [Staurois parvus]|uniref:Uncharacterized protein n=1 Tax=Staurois parvus TaxID=386267 RepID=A0ABN9G392_9NEOB|nr:unnamed protein product [Staurois parvus]